MKYKFSIIYLIAFAFSLKAQHGDMTIGALNHNLAINPAITGSSNNLKACMSFRNDWIGDEKHPRSLVISLHGPLKTENWGFGTLIYNDRIGVQKQTAWYGFGAYKIKTNLGLLSLGFKTGFSSLNYASEDFILNDSDDEVFEKRNSNFTLAFGLGVFLHKKNYYFGLSIPEFSNAASHKFISISDKNHWNKRIVGGYTWKINENLNLNNHFLIRKIGKGESQIQYIPIVEINEKYSTGIILRTSKAYGFILGYRLSEQLKVSYNFDYIASNLLPRSVGNHEIVISYNFSEQINTYNPKFF